MIKARDLATLAHALPNCEQALSSYEIEAMVELVADQIMRLESCGPMESTELLPRLTAQYRPIRQAAIGALGS
jgi:hypothetical protein